MRGETLEKRIRPGGLKLVTLCTRSIARLRQPAISTVTTMNSRCLGKNLISVCLRGRSA
jgi:hypothetical protein